MMTRGNDRRLISAGSKLSSLSTLFKDMTPVLSPKNVRINVNEIRNRMIKESRSFDVRFTTYVLNRISFN
jgi:uncharacterized protein (UPF0147 family)